MRKNLIIVIGSLDIGGAEQHLVRMLSEFNFYGWSARVITLAKQGVLAPNLERQGISVTSTLTPKSLRLIQKLPQVIGKFLGAFLCIVRLQHKLRQEKNSILHFYLPESYMLGMIAAQISGFSGHKIMSRRSLNHYQKKRLGSAWLEKLLHPKTSLIIGNSQAVVEELNIKEGVPQEHLKLIYNGIDTSLFITTKSREEVRRNLQIENDVLVMIIIANLIPYKGHVDLLNALGKIKDKLPKGWRLMIVGRDDGIGGSLKNHAENLGISNSILWLGMRNDIPDLLKSADMGILSSHEEGFSNAILEGMAAGLPMVVTDVGGNKEAVVSGKTGYVVPARDKNALAAAILEIANDPSKALEFGHQGFLRVKEHFSMESCVKAYIELYEDLWARGKR